MEKSKVIIYWYRQLHSIHKTNDIYKDISEDVETRFETSNYELDELLPKGKNEKIIGLMKDEWGGEQRLTVT